jgi:hypothetical protein
MLIALILCFGVMLIGHAQQQEREIYTALAYGDDVFEPEMWYASAVEEESRTKATWTSSEFDSVAFLDYLHFTDGIEPDAFDEFFDKEWFNVTLSNYQDWEQQSMCSSGDSLLFEFDVIFEDGLYKMRYWIVPVTPYRVAASFMVFPTDNPQAMDEYAARWSPDFASCGQNS